MGNEFVMPDPGVPKIALERIDLNSEKAATYIAESKPFVAHVDWPARAWTPDLLRERVGNATVSMTKQTGEKVDVTVTKYLDLIDNHVASAREYVMHNFPAIRLWGTMYDGENPQLASLFPDLPLPAFIQPRAGYIWTSNKGAYNNGSHCEPNASPGLNVQILGKKHVWLFSPEDAGLIGASGPLEEMMGPPFFSANQTVFAPSPDHPEFSRVRCYEAVLEPGDLIHIPAFWYHWFVHYDLYQLNVNVWFGTEQVPVSPVSAEWAYMNALCLALGGWDDAPKKFAALPEETQKLLHQIATTLIEDRRCTDVQQWLDAKYSPRKWETDLKYRKDLYIKPADK